MTRGKYRETSKSKFQESVHDGEWKYEFRPVAIEEIGQPKLEPWDRTKSYSKQELREGLNRLPEVQRRMAQGWGKPEFSNLWNSQDSYNRSLAKTYQGFYGGDRIKLCRRKDGSLDVVNGTHRIDLAREMGLNELPAEVAYQDNGEDTVNMERRKGINEREAGERYRNQESETKGFERKKRDELECEPGEGSGPGYQPTEADQQMEQQRETLENSETEGADAAEDESRQMEQDRKELEEARKQLDEMDEEEA